MPACPRPGVYVPRQTHDCDAAVLVRRHLPGFVARLEEAGHTLPEFVKKELEGFAGCGDFERGFVRTACRTCGDELRVPFACKNRGCCPSCMGRRMAEGAALLVDHVLPAVGYRQWVLSFQGPLAVRLGYDQTLLAKVAESLAQAVMRDMRRSVKERHGLASVAPLHSGVFTAVQRFRSDLGLCVHLQIVIIYARIIPPAVIPAPEQQLALRLANAANDDDASVSSPSPGRIGWAKLLARVFALNVTLCRKCGGRMRVLEIVDTPDDIAASFMVPGLHRGPILLPKSCCSPVDRAPSVPRLPPACPSRCRRESPPHVRRRVDRPATACETP